MSSSMLGSPYIAAISLMLLSPLASGDVHSFARRIEESIINRESDDVDGLRGWTTLTYATDGQQLVRESGHVLIGADWQRGDWLAGMAVGYAGAGYTYKMPGSDVLVGGSFANPTIEFESFDESLSIAPYVAYRLQGNAVFSGQVGFDHQGNDVGTFEVPDGGERVPNSVGRRPGMNTPFADLAVDGIWRTADWMLRGRVGYRFIYRIYDDSGFFRPTVDAGNVDFKVSVPDVDDHFLYGFAEAGYQIGAWMPLIRGRVEAEISNTSDHDQLVFVGGGLRYRAERFAEVNVVYETEVNGISDGFHQALLNISIHF